MHCSAPSFRTIQTVCGATHTRHVALKSTVLVLQQQERLLKRTHIHTLAIRPRRMSSYATASGAKLTSTSRTNYFSSDQRPVILYDGVCNLCNTGVDFLLKADSQQKFRLAALQSEAGKALLSQCGRKRDDISSIVLVEKDGHYIKSEAVLRIAKGLGLPLFVVAQAMLASPKFVRDAVYDQVANNRYNLLGTRDELRTPDPLSKSRFISE